MVARQKQMGLAVWLALCAAAVPPARAQSGDRIDALELVKR